MPNSQHYLPRMGSYVCLCGKTHFVGPYQLHGFEERLTTDIYPADLGWTPDWERPDNRPSWYHNILSFVQAGVCRSSTQLDSDEEVAFQAVRKIYDLARSDDERPFCLFVSFSHPHDPFAICDEFWDLYDHEAIKLPTVPPIPVEELDPRSRRLRFVCDLGRYRQTEQRVRKARHAYYGAISYVDDKVGQIPQTLQGAGFADDTMNLFTSDHGEMLGQRGLWFKMNSFEWSARVPMIIHAPRMFKPRRVAHHVSLLDVLPTLVEMAAGEGLPPLPTPADRHSLVPPLRGKESAGHDLPAGEILCDGAIALCFMNRRDSYKYIFCPADPEQSYDRLANLRELSNLVAQPEYDEVGPSFRKEVMERLDAQGMHEEALASQLRLLLVAEVPASGTSTSRGCQPHQDASQQYIRSPVRLDGLERQARLRATEVHRPECLGADQD